MAPSGRQDRLVAYLAAGRLPPWASRPSPRLVLGFEDAGIRLQKGILEGEGGAGPLQKAVASLLNDKFAHQQILQFGRAFRE